jgi:hypothetical protein
MLKDMLNGTMPVLIWIRPRTPCKDLLTRIYQFNLNEKIGSVVDVTSHTFQASYLYPSIETEPAFIPR